MQARSKSAKSRWIRAIVSALLLCTTAGAILLTVWFFRTPEPPDAQKAPIDEINSYINSSAFMNTSTRRRGQLVDAVMRRYARMTSAERAETRKKLTCLRKNWQTRQVFWVSWAVKVAGDYHKLPPDEKRKFVDRWAKMLGPMGGRVQLQKTHRHFSSRGRRGAGRQSRSALAVTKDKKNILDNTTAEERAQLFKFAGAVIKRLKEKHGI